MEEERTPRERALDLIRLLVGVEPNWQPAPHHYLWIIRIAVAGTLAVVVLVLMGNWVWGMLVDYIQPKTATQRKDVANIFVVIAAGVVGTLTAIAALGNLYMSRRNLQNARAALRQQRDLDLSRRSAEALQAYFEQMGDLLLDKGLHKKADPYDVTRVTARARTLAVLEQLDGGRKRTVLLFLRESRLINREPHYRGGVRVAAHARLVGLRDADLTNADLREARLISADSREAVSLEGANLEGADLVEANLARADLREVVLKNADMSGTILRGADLRGADLMGAKGWTEEQLAAAESLAGATMPDGQKYEDWLKSKGSGEDGENQ